MATTKVRLKLLIDTKDHRVLSAEAGKDFVDFIFDILSLPVGTVIRLLTKEGMVGCLGNLYGSIENISDTYIQPNQNKDSLLKPTLPNHGANVPLLLPNIQSSTSAIFYRCSFNTTFYNCSMYVSNDPNAICPQCNRCMNQKLMFVNPPAEASSSNEGGFVKGVVTYMVMDDLVVTPMSIISGLTLINKCNVGALEEKVVDLDMDEDEGVKLLKASLQSKRVLTDVFLGEKVFTDVCII